MTTDNFHRKLTEIINERTGFQIPVPREIPGNRLDKLYAEYERYHYNRGLSMLRADVRKELIAQCRTGDNLYREAVDNIIAKGNAGEISMGRFVAALDALQKIKEENVQPVLIP